LLGEVPRNFLVAVDALDELRLRHLLLPLFAPLNKGARVKIRTWGVNGTWTILVLTMTATGKVTYVSLAADDPEMNAAYDAAIAQVGKELGRTYPLHIAGQTRAGTGTVDSISPTDTRVVVARVASATKQDVDDAVAAARAAFPVWSATPWTQRA